MSALSHSRGLRVLYLLPSCCLGFSLLATPALAQTINYPGDGTALQPDPIFSDYSTIPPTPYSSLFPATSLTGNNVTMGGDVPGLVYGGVTTGAGDVTNNRVTLNSGTVEIGIRGGITYSGGDTTGNSVFINGGIVNGAVHGGQGNNSIGN